MSNLEVYIYIHVCINLRKIIQLQTMTYLNASWECISDEEIQLPVVLMSVLWQDLNNAVLSVLGDTLVDFAGNAEEVLLLGKLGVKNSFKR